jgi:hypothetical protein
MKKGIGWLGIRQSADIYSQDRERSPACCSRAHAEYPMGRRWRRGMTTNRHALGSVPLDHALDAAGQVTKW